MHRKPAAVAEYRDHASDRDIIFFFFTHSLGSFGREHFAAEIAAQLLQFIDRRFYRRPSDQTHQHSGFTLEIDFPAFTFRARVSRFQRRVRNMNVVPATIGFRRMTSVTRGFGLRRR